MTVIQPETMLTALGSALNCLRVEVLLLQQDGGASGTMRTRRLAYQAEHVIRVLDGETDDGSWLVPNVVQNEL